MLGKWRKLPMKSRRSPGTSGAARKRSRSTPLGITTLGTPTISASFGDMTTTRGKAAQGAGFEAAPAEGVPGGGERALAARDLGEEVEGDVVLHQDVAAVFGELGVFHLERFEAEGAALFADGLPHGGRAELVDLGRQQGAPARLAIARLFDQHDAGAEFQQRRRVPRGHR